MGTSEVKLIDYNPQRFGVQWVKRAIMDPDREPGLSEYTFEVWERVCLGGMSFSQPIRHGVIGLYRRERVSMVLIGGTYTTGTSKWLGVENTTTH